jgi:hypothetical protein
LSFKAWGWSLQPGKNETAACICRAQYQSSRDSRRSCLAPKDGADSRADHESHQSAEVGQAQSGAVAKCLLVSILALYPVSHLCESIRAVPVLSVSFGPKTVVPAVRHNRTDGRRSTIINQESSYTPTNRCDKLSINQSINQYTNTPAHQSAPKHLSGPCSGRARS